MASPPTQPNYSAMDGTEYPAAVDDMTAVNARIAASFACYESSAPAMTVEVNAGHLPATGAAPTIVAAQQETIAAAPAAPNTRVDLIELDPATGTTTVNAGAAGNPGVAPSATSSLQVIAEIAVGSDVMEIVNADITDRRSLYTLEGIAPTAASLAGVGLAVNGAALDLDFSELTTDGSLASTDHVVVSTMPRRSDAQSRDGG